jgi:hypothetical protein
MRFDLKAGIVRILKSDGSTAGTGFVVSEEGLIATCAHVIQFTGGRPGDTVRLVLHITNQERWARVEPEWWRAPDAEDVAILRLEGHLPAEVSTLLLDSSGAATGCRFKTFGFPEETSVEGMWGYGILGDATTEAGCQVLQLTDTTEVTTGFSGAPVLNTVTQQVVGIVSAITAPDKYGRLTETAFITPSETLWAACPPLQELTVEARYRRLLETVYGFWARLFTPLEMSARERGRQPAARRGWIPPSFYAIEEDSKDQPREAPPFRHVPLPAGLAEALDRYEAIVLLGEPGAGKTTALDHLAGRLATDSEQIPVLVHLRRYEQGGRPLPFLERAWALSLQEDLNAAIRSGETDEIPLHLADETVTPLAMQLEHLLEQGRLVLLLDGLNEMPGLVVDDVRLSYLAAFVDRARAHGNQLVVACRILDYAALRQPLERPLQSVVLEPLDNEHIRIFLHSYLGDEEGEELARWLQQQEQGTTRELCRIPFFLRLVVHLYEREREPPANRLDLLDQYVVVAVTQERDRLLQDWPPVELLKPLSNLAVAMQTEGTLEVWQGDARQYLSDFSAGGAGAALRIAEGTGLLRATLTQDPHGARLHFSHQIWQQYLAAQALVHKAGDGLALFEAIRAHLLDETWADTVALAAARLQDATPFLEQLLAANDEDQDLQRPLFRAAAALAEGATGKETVRRKVVDGLVALARTRDWWDLGQADASGALSALRRMGDQYAMAGLLDLARDPTLDNWTRVEVADTLGDLGQVDQAGDVLLALARDPAVPGGARLKVTQSLGKLKRVDEAVPILLDLLYLRGDDSYLGEEFGWTIETLVRWGRLREATPKVLELARDPYFQVNDELDDINDETRWVLDHLGRGDDVAVILQSVGRDQAEPGEVRLLAAASLQELGCEKEAKSILSELAYDTHLKGQSRWEAASLLGGMAEETALPARLTLVCDTELEASARLWAADDVAELVYLGMAWEREGVAEDAEAPVSAGEHMAVAREFEQLDRRDDAMVAYLALACDTALEDDTRIEATNALSRLSRGAQLPGGENAIVPILLALARSAAAEAYDRLLAARSLAQLGHVMEAVPTLLTLAQTPDVDDDTRVWAVEALGALGWATPEVLDGLQALEEDNAVSDHLHQAARKAIQLLQSTLEE